MTFKALGELEYYVNSKTDPLYPLQDQRAVAKWILRMLSYRHGVEVSFAPEIIVGKAGSDLHIKTIN